MRGILQDAHKGFVVVVESFWNHSLEWTWLLASGGRDARRGVGRASGDEGESEGEDENEGYVMGVELSSGGIREDRPQCSLCAGGEEVDWVGRKLDRRGSLLMRSAGVTDVDNISYGDLEGHIR